MSGLLFLAATVGMTFVIMGAGKYFRWLHGSGGKLLGDLRQAGW
jgi:hypothetical protein